MINLLSDDKKAEIRAGRVNVVIVNYIVMLTVALLVLAAVVGGTFITLTISHANATSRVEDNNQTARQYQDDEQTAKQYRENLATAKQILDKEINYSSLIYKISKAIPSNVVLGELSLDAATIGQPTTITAHAKNRRGALQLKTSFEEKTDLFSNVYLTQIEQAETPTVEGYPYNITMALTINKGALQ